LFFPNNPPFGGSILIYKEFFMKNVFKVFAIIALVAVIGFSFTTCNDGNNGNKDDENKVNNPFIGTWECDSFTLICTDTTWITSPGSTTGTYTYNGTTAIFIDNKGYKYGTGYFTNSGTIRFVDAISTNILTKSDGSNKTPKIADFNISGTGTVYFDPTAEAKKVTVTAQTGKTTGAVTVYYESTDKETYPKVDEPPIFYGTYNVTFDVEEATGWNGAEGLTAGTLTIADGTPSTPTGISITIESLTSLKVSWTSVDRATRYRVYYITADMDELTLAGTVTTNSFTHSGLTLNVDDIYYYYVIAVSDKYGESNYSDFKSIVIDKPVAPASVRATAVSANKINLQWSSVSSATGYKVYYNTTGSLSGAMGEVNDTYTSTSTSLTGATAETTYYFWIKAINPIGMSEFSTPAASAKTLSTPVTDVKISAAIRMIGNRETIRVTVNQVYLMQFERYYIFYTTDSPDNPKRFFAGDGEYSMFYHDELNPTPNTTYYFWATRGDKYCDGFPFDIISGQLSEFVNESRVHGYSEMVSVRTGSPPPPPAPTPTPTLPPAASTPPSGGSTGQKICPVCKGDGKCSGHYLIYYCKNGYLDCSKCNGSGKVSNNICTRCNGKGKEKCGLCNGDGKCRRCNGKGKI
jgi:hypothetical protein